ncbi:MAG: carboxymuconolactone decarboxylase family protein [Alphaproteobacteria bacterium]|nr:carboxymuconolactone decarboxylase family protein [Alphaproteobacteria bacterium]
MRSKTITQCYAPRRPHHAEVVMAQQPRPKTIRERFGDFSPKLVDLTEGVLFGDVWERPGLSKRDRSLITVAALVALNRTEQLRGHLGRAIDNGVKKDELVELITHLAFYSGWPTAMSAVTVAHDVLAEK